MLQDYESSHSAAMFLNSFVTGENISPRRNKVCKEHNRIINSKKSLEEKGNSPLTLFDLNDSTS